MKNRLLVTLFLSFWSLNGIFAEQSKPEKVSPFREGKKAGETWTNSKGITFCWCPPGNFKMNGKTVEIKVGFWIAKYETTKGQWTGKNLNRKSISKHKDEPVVHVTQSKSVLRGAIGKMNKIEVGKFIPEDWEYSLPTSEQWEYAARAGTTTKFFFGDDINLLPKYANFADKSFYDSKGIYSNYAHRTLDDGTVKLAKVGQYKPNPWGLYDMYGNAAEFCHGAIFRGGSWLSEGKFCNSEYTDQVYDRFESNYIGFRMVIRKKGSIPEPKKKK